MKNSDLDNLDQFLKGEKTSESFDDGKAAEMLAFKENSFNSDPLLFKDEDQSLNKKYDFEEY